MNQSSSKLKSCVLSEIRSLLLSIVAWVKSSTSTIGSFESYAYWSTLFLELNI